MKRSFLPSILLSAAALSAPAIFAGSLDEIRELEPQHPNHFPFDDKLVAFPDAEEPDIEIFSAGGHYYKRVVTSTKPQTTTSEDFIPLKGARTQIRVPAGRNALVNVAYTAESRCNERDSTAGNWCEVRILVDGVEAAPAASSFPPDTYAFDSTDSGTETSASWESHAMDRHHCVLNQKGNTTKLVPIEVEWKVTNFDGGAAPNFWLDDWSLTVELARGCRYRAVNDL